MDKPLSASPLCSPEDPLPAAAIPPLRVTIAGLGLIGGSLALALCRRAAYTVAGLDRDPAVQQLALARGAIERIADTHWPEATDLLLLALPPEAAMAVLEQSAPRMKPGTVVSDVCGVKRAVMDACVPLCRRYGLHFIGGHPMAGKEKSGFTQADASLFTGASYILTPAPDTPPAAMQTMERLATAVGCTRLTVTTPEEHDRLIAFTSQLPHVLAGAYVQSPCCARHHGFSAGSYRDVSRVATVDEALWSRLFLLNRDNLGTELDELIAHLGACREALRNGDEAALLALLRQGRLCKETADEPPPASEEHDPREGKSL